MRRLTPLLLVLLAACKRQTPEPVLIEEPPRLAQTLNMSNLEHAGQLTRGFYAVEDNAWRWTKGKFSCVLSTPVTAPAKGATLVVRMTIPEPLIKDLKDVTLNVAVNGVRLKTVNYTSPGRRTVKLDVPPNALKSNPAAVDFVLDKVLPPRPADQRELGVIVSSIGFERKT